MRLTIDNQRLYLVRQVEVECGESIVAAEVGHLVVMAEVGAKPVAKCYKLVGSCLTP